MIDELLLLVQTKCSNSVSTNSTSSSGDASAGVPVPVQVVVHCAYRLVCQSASQLLLYFSFKYVSFDLDPLSL